MRSLTKTGIRILSAKYRSILIKCAIINASVFIGAFGSASVMAENLPAAIQDETVPSYTLISDETMTSDLGTLEGENRNFTIFGNGSTIDGNSHAGITVNNGQTLTINDASMQNFEDTDGGAIYNNGTIESITGATNTEGKVVAFYNNAAPEGSGGAILNDGGAEIGSITGDFIDNSALVWGGAIYNGESEITGIVGDFINNSVISVADPDSHGGAIANMNYGTNSIISGITGNFTNNHAVTSGGAIYNFSYDDSATSAINIIAKDGKDIIFSGNYVTSEYGRGGAISNDGAGSVLGLYAKEANDTITFVGGEDDTTNNKYDIDGIFNIGTLNINGDGTNAYSGTVNLYNVTDAATARGTTNIYGGNVNVKDTFAQKDLNLNAGTLNLGKDANVTNFYANGGALSMSIPYGTFDDYSNEISTLTVDKFTGTLNNFTVDFGPGSSNEPLACMDKISINAIEGTPAIHLTAVNVLGNSELPPPVTATYLTGDGKDSILTTEIGNIKTAIDGYTYTFTFDGAGKGNVLVTMNADEQMSLPAAIADATMTGYSAQLNPVIVYGDLGTLAGENRNFTIFGNGSTIDGNGHAGITINNGQTFTLNNADMQNFKKEDGTKNGGAIENNGTITSITGNFEHNSAATNGGAIYNKGTIGNADGTGGIDGNFNDNTAQGGAAIWNESGTITNIKGNFTSNASTNSYGAIYNKTGAIIGNADGTGGIDGNFEYNTGANGGAIANAGTITNIKGNFTVNSTTNMGGAIVNSNTINKVTGNFINNSATNSGGAIYNAKTINFVAEDSDITFNGNYVTTGNGGAIFNATTGTVGLYASADHSITFTGDTTGLPSTANNVDSIHNINILNINGDGTITPYTGTVNLYNVTDAAVARGITNIYGGIVNVVKELTQNIINVNSGATLASNIDNVEIKADGTYGNLINDGTINITGANSRFGADHLTNNGTVNITGANSLLETVDLTNNGTMDIVSLLSYPLNNNGSITTSGGIEAIIQNNEGGSITFNGDAKKQMELTNSGTVNFNGGLSETGSIIRLTQNDGVMNFSTVAINSTINHSIDNFTMNGGTVNIADGSINTLHINQLTLSGNTNFAIDADLADDGQMDQLNVTSVNGSGNIVISDIKLLSDANDDYMELSLFADDSTKGLLADKVSGNLNGLKYSTIYKYDALYDSATGMIGFTRYNSGTSDDFNPYLYAPSAVANTTATMTTQIAALAMDKMDDVVHTQGHSGGDTTKSSNAWVKVMGLNDNVEFKNFENVDSKALTVAAGYNTNKITCGDCGIIFGAYAGYIGGKQHYTANDIDQNGGYVGLSSALTLGNAFLTATVNGGLLKNKANNMYGSDRFNTLWLGTGLKAGYNYALTDSVVLQPNVYGGYTLVNTKDYTSVSGVKIATDNLNFFEVDPGLKLSAVIADGWTGSVQGKYAIVMDNGADITANDIALQNISTKNYIEYGIGIDKSVTDAFYLGAKINRRDGGRTGWNGSIEFRYKF